MGQSTPTLPAPLHDITSETEYNTTLAARGRTDERALRRSVFSHLAAYPQGINESEPRASIPDRRACAGFVYRQE